MQKNTLRYHLSRPVFRKLDISDVPAAAIAERMRLRMSQMSADVGAEPEALRFYLANHFLADMQLRYHPDQPLQGDTLDSVKNCVREMNECAERLFFYLIAICTRETRHNHNTPKFTNWADGKIDGEAVALVNTTKGKSSSGAVHKFTSLSPGSPIKMGEYTKALCGAFYHGQYAGGYGGKAWGQVADCLNMFVQGQISAEAMVDTGWTLCHNNGPIFNKGMLYSGYAHPPKKYLTKLLDVQRAGQIPRLFRELQVHGHAQTGFEKGLLDFYNSLAPVAGWDSLPAYVDWAQVEALGSVNKYPKEKQHQIQNYTASPEELAKMKAEAEAAEKAAIAKALADKAEYYEKWFDVAPGVKVEKVKRAA